MQIKLSWENRNSTDDGTRIYKSNAVIASNALPAVLVTLPPGASSYTDADVLRDQTYHYRIEIFKGGDKSLSQNIVATAVPYTGPGPQDLIAGDFERGYFGQVDPLDFITYDAIAEWASVAFNSFGTQYTSYKWLKFAHKGKILFVAQNPIRFGMPWLTLYNKGLVYGVDHSGNPGLAGLAAVNQKRVVSIAGNKFLVRLLKGKAPGVTTVVTLGANNDEATFDLAVPMKGSEWDDLMVGVCLQKPASFQGESLGLIDYAAMYPVNYGAPYTMTLCQEILSTGFNTVRGGACTRAGYFPNMYAGYADSFNHASSGSPSKGILNNNTTDYQGVWRPVLEWTP